jgi:hypothetical protein
MGFTNLFMDLGMHSPILPIFTVDDADLKKEEVNQIKKALNASERIGLPSYTQL